MRRVFLFLICTLLASCTNVAQMQRKYEAGDESQLDKMLQIAGRADYPYATRRKAARALGETGAERAVPVLIGLLYEYDQRITLKQEALIALGKIGDREAVEPIGRMLDFQLSASSAELRMTAIEVLGELGGSKAAEILVNALRYYDLLMLRDEQNSYRGIFSGQEQIYVPNAGYADTTSPWMRGPTVGMRPEGQRPPIGMFGLPLDNQAPPYDPTPEERVLAYAALVRIGQEVIPVVEDFLASNDTTVSLRRELAEIVAEIQDPETAPDSSSAALPEAAREQE